MPILASFPVISTPESLTNPFLESRSLAFQSLDGATLLPFTGDEFIALWGIQGLDMMKRDVVEEQVPGQDGTDLVDIQIGSRSYTLPLFIGSNSGHLPYLQNRAYLRSFFNHRSVDYKANGGTFDLVATSILGDRSLRSVYVDNTNGTLSQDSAGSWWESAGLSCLAVRPNWRGTRWTTPQIRPPAGVPWFGAFPPGLSSSQALGQSMLVSVGGDVESWCQVDVTGPADSVEIFGNGIYVSVPDGLGAGEQCTIDTDPRSRRALFGGVSDWARVAPSTLWSPLVAGDQQITISVAGAGSTTVAVVSGWNWHDTPW